jgi:hypothetical protein
MLYYFFKNYIKDFIMKKILLLGSITALLSTGCAIRPTQAFIYSDSVAPAQVTNVSASTAKSGESDECTNILGLIATGDCSIASAKRNSGISSVATVDWKGTNILGIYSTGKTVITGK